MVNWKTLKIKEYKDVDYYSLKDKIFIISMFLAFLGSVFGLFYSDFIVPDDIEKATDLNFIFMIILMPTSLSPLGIYCMFEKKIFYDVIVELNLTESRELEKLLSNKGFLLSNLNTKVEDDALVVDFFTDFTDFYFKTYFESAYLKVKDGKTYFVGKILRDRFNEFTMNSKDGYSGESRFKDIVENNIKTFFEKLCNMKSLDNFILNNRGVDSL